MITAHIIGGLGNQMFQYAAGRALAERLNQSLQLDISSFVRYELHNGFELDRIFKGEMHLATPIDIQRALGWRGLPVIKSLLMRPQFSMLRGCDLIVEPYLHYWAGFNQVSPNAYLMGYWQSENYFQFIEAIIRADFVFKQAMSNSNQLIADEIEQSNAVSLHVRRGDYVQNAETFAIHGACSLDYYKVAIKYIVDKISQPQFFIFSDDIAWVKENLKINSPCFYVDGNYGRESYNDMRLMSLCKHHIIANSSFSWWGAWLNQYASKIVIAPNKWFAHSANVKDLLPESWVKL